MSTSFFCSTSVQYPFLFEISWQIFSTLFKKDLLRIPISNIYPSHLSFKPSSSYGEINVFLLLQCIHRPPLAFFLIVESMLVSFFFKHIHFSPCFFLIALFELFVVDFLAYQWLLVVLIVPGMIFLHVYVTLLPLSLLWWQHSCYWCWCSCWCWCWCHLEGGMS